MSKVTIGLVTYNRPILLKRAISSILKQKFNNFEVLIGNDYISQKLSFESLGIRKDKRIKIFNHKKNLGEKNNKNYLLNKSKSEWFIWLADDDYFHPNFFKIMIKNIDSNQNIIAHYSNFSRKELKNENHFYKPKIYNKLDFLEKFANQKIRLIGVYGLIKTKYLKKIKGIHATGKSFMIDNKLTHIYPYCDFLVPILLSRYGKISWTKNKLIYLNTSEESVSAISTDYQVYTSAERYILSNLKESIGKKTNYKIKNRIIFNVLNRFAFIRLSLIRKINPFLNLFNIIKYFKDKNVFKNVAKKNGVHQTNFNYINIILSILMSFKNL